MDPLRESSEPTAPRAALQLYTVRAALERDREGTLRRVHELGFRAVETAGFKAELPSAATPDELERYGFDLVSSYFVGDVGRFSEHLDEQQASGNNMIVLGLGEDYFSDRASVLRAVDLVNELSDQCTARSMRLGYHNHPWEVGMLEDGQSALEVFTAGLRDEVALEFDFYWAQVGGLSIERASTIAGPRIERLQLKDGPLTETQIATVFGEGLFDIPAAIRAAPTARWHIVAFDEFDGDLLEPSGADLRYLLENGLSTV